jgi:diphthamide synthase (EF-2-diphthine--ammonia ligase)
MHGVRRELLRRQAAALDLPLEIVTIPPVCANATYEERMRSALGRWRAAGVERVLCGDIFLEDVRRYREERLFRGEMRGLFPLWGRDSRELAQRFLGLGFRAVLCCVDTQALPADFAGRPYDAALLADLPPGADPCGENGEFHTFVSDGPLFRSPVPYTLGERTLRDGRFAYCDLLPG